MILILRTLFKLACILRPSSSCSSYHMTSVPSLLPDAFQGVIWSTHKHLLIACKDKTIWARVAHKQLRCLSSVFQGERLVSMQWEQRSCVARRGRIKEGGSWEGFREVEIFKLSLRGGVEVFRVGEERWSIPCRRHDAFPGAYVFPRHPERLSRGQGAGGRGIASRRRHERLRRKPQRTGTLL